MFLEVIQTRQVLRGLLTPVKKSVHNYSSPAVIYFHNFRVTFRQRYLCSPVDKPSRYAASDIVIVTHKCYNNAENCQVNIYASLLTTMVPKKIKQLWQIWGRNGEFCIVCPATRSAGILA